MGRSSSDKLTHQLRIEIKAPPFFRCPISLEVMRSPVSLSTGVTYDRSSIQRWFDTGNTTCPATMLPLSSTDLVPNLTLRRLINLWSSSSPLKFNDLLTPTPTSSSPSSDPLTVLHNLSAFLSEPDADPSAKNRVAMAAGFTAAVVSALNNPTAASVAIGVVSLLLDSDCIEEETKKAVVSAIRADLGGCLPCVVNILKDDKIEPQFKNNSLNVLAAVLSSDAGSDLEKETELLMPELISVINGGAAVAEGLGCVIELLHCKRAVKAVIESGAVAAMVKIVCSGKEIVAVERAIVVLEAVASCRSGRAAMMKGEVLEECVEGVVGRMMKVGKGGREAAVGLLWSLCFGSGGKGGGGRAKEAVAGTKGGMGKILVMMQGDCSAAVRRMAGDLLRVFRVADAKNLVAGYNTRTTHIMPF